MVFVLACSAPAPALPISSLFPMSLLLWADLAHCLSILITGQGKPFANHYHREKRQPWSRNTYEKGQVMHHISQRHKNRKFGIGYLEAKPNMDFEDKKKSPRAKCRWEKFLQGFPQGKSLDHLGQQTPGHTPLLPRCRLQLQRPSVFS